MPESGPGRRRPLLWSGVALVIVGVMCLGYVAWEFWGTTYLSKRKSAELIEQTEREWERLDERSSSGDDDDRTSEVTGEGVVAIMRIPRFGEDWERPILLGTESEQLSAGVGQYTQSVAPGGRGNYSVAAHRRTHGEPFVDFPELRAGDVVEVQTRTATYVYELDSGGQDLEVTFRDDWVLDTPPVDPDAEFQPPDHQRLITLTTCAYLFSSDYRLVAFGHLRSVERTG